jgi:phage terminase Nu1 subunit (DNA packaging protein)
MATLPTVSGREFAALCKVSAQTVTNWMNAGMPAKRSGRQGQTVRISLAAALPWVVANKETAGSERQRLASEQANKLALENARRRGELIYADQVAECLSRLAADLAARHDALPGRLAGELAGLNDAATIRGRLLEELRAVRRAFADATAELADALGSDPDDGADPDAAPEPHEPGVGRRKPRASARKRGAGAVSK